MVACTPAVLAVLCSSANIRCPHICCHVDLQAAAKEPDSSCPAVRLLGYLEAPPSDEAFELCENPADTLWLVYKFEGMRPLTLALQQMDLPEEPTGLSSMFMKK
jgi:hypothetical protein